MEISFQRTSIFRYGIILIFLIVAFLFGYIFSSTQVIPGENTEQGNTSNYLRTDVSLNYKTQYETIIRTDIAFFQNRNMTLIPLSLGDWTGEDVIFDNITYEFYRPDEIFGRKYHDSQGDIIYFTVSIGPKVSWHNPQICYAFSNSSILEKDIEWIGINPQDTGKLDIKNGIFANKIISESGHTNFVTLYWYVLRDRLNLNDAVLISVSSPFSRDQNSALRMEKEFLREIFSLQPDISSGNQFATEHSLSPDESSAINEWLIIGAWSSMDSKRDVLPFSDWDYNWLGDEIESIKPSAGDTIKGNTWQLYPTNEGLILLDSLDSMKSKSYAYMFEYIFSNATETVFLSLGSKDGVRIWLNGEQKYGRIRGSSNLVRGVNHLITGHDDIEDTIPITLNQGWNYLLIETYRWSGSWIFSSRVTNLDGDPVPGIIFSSHKPVELSRESVVIFQIGYDDDSSGEFGSEWDAQDDYYIGEGFQYFERAVTGVDSLTRIHFTLTKDQSMKSHTFFLEAYYVDPGSAGYVIVNIFVNDHYAASYVYPQDWMATDILLDRSLFREGENTIKLEWVSGGTYAVWDYLSLS